MEEGKDVEVPNYSFITHTRETTTTTVHAVDVILVEGILIFAPVELKKSFNMKIMCYEDADVCLARRIKRDIVERGRTPVTVIDRYLRYVKPSYEKNVLPHMKSVDLIVPNAAYNKVALASICDHIVSTIALLP